MSAAQGLLQDTLNKIIGNFIVFKMNYFTFKNPQTNVITYKFRNFVIFKFYNQNPLNPIVKIILLTLILYYKFCFHNWS